MGWLFKPTSTRKELIAERTKHWERTLPDGTVVTTTCLARCFRGGSFSGVLCSVWQRQFIRDGKEVQPEERWINCDLLRYHKDDGWGHKDMDESMHPFYYSCPLKYLDLAPLEKYGGNAEWRLLVRQHHERRRQKRQHCRSNTR